MKALFIIGSFIFPWIVGFSAWGFVRDMENDKWQIAIVIAFVFLSWIAMVIGVWACDL